MATESRFNKDLLSIYFIDSQRGWAAGADRTILSTSDGGASWQPQPQSSGTQAWLTSIIFIDSNRGWVAGSDGAILTTSDGGASWHAQSSGAQADLHSIIFIDSNRG